MLPFVNDVGTKIIKLYATFYCQFGIILFTPIYNAKIVHLI